MIDCKIFSDQLVASGIDRFVGVPDSLLKSFCAYAINHFDSDKHIITANEGSAIAYATGAYLGSGKLSLVYLQNSGIGNTINPLISLADPSVYSIPMVVLVGWRGEPGVKDEPQHVRQGEVMLPMLESLGIPYEILPSKEDDALEVVDHTVKAAIKRQGPVCLIVKKGVFGDAEKVQREPNSYKMSREEAIGAVVESLSEDATVVSTTGKASRELFEYRASRGGGHDADFLTVGSMGHCSQIALGLSDTQPDRQVVCLDGDGAVLMHMGGLASIGQHAGRNFLHVVINNGAHESVGGQPTDAFGIDLAKIALACGYKGVKTVNSKEKISKALEEMNQIDGPNFLEVRTRVGSRDDLGRPTLNPKENRQAFMTRLNK